MAIVSAAGALEAGTRWPLPDRFPSVLSFRDAYLPARRARHLCVVLLGAALLARPAPLRSQAVDSDDEAAAAPPAPPTLSQLEKDYSTVHMRGPARSLFDATIDVARLMSR